MPAKLLIKANDNNVPQSPGRWLRGETVAVVDENATLGSGELNTNSFYRYTVTDASVLDMQLYLQTWDMDLNVSLIGAGPGGTDDVSVTNSNINVSQTIGVWTQPLVDQFIDGWNAEHPTAGMISLGFSFGILDTRATYIVPASIVVLEEYSQDFGHGQMFKRKIWNGSIAGMNGIQGNGGVDSGTQLDIEAIMDDGLLD
jgi:hypothetical protein